MTAELPVGESGPLVGPRVGVAANFGDGLAVGEGATVGVGGSIGATVAEGDAIGEIDGSTNWLPAA